MYSIVVQIYNVSTTKDTTTLGQTKDDRTCVKLWNIMSRICTDHPLKSIVHMNHSAIVKMNYAHMVHMGYVRICEKI